MIKYQLNNPEEFQKDVIEILKAFEFNVSPVRKYTLEVAKVILSIEVSSDTKWGSNLWLDKDPNVFRTMYGHEELFMCIALLMRKHGKAEYFPSIINRPFTMVINDFAYVMETISRLIGQEIKGLGGLYRLSLEQNIKG